MTIRNPIRLRHAGAPAYYQGRPASLWLAALAPRRTKRTSPGASCPGQRAAAKG